MSTLKKRLVALVASSAMVFSASSVSGQDYTYVNGQGYQEYRTSPNLAPGIALGLITLAAIIAVSIQNSTNDHSHS